eukprot:scaffold4730_cov109-Isochrysis_galbana.AAC.8
MKGAQRTLFAIVEQPFLECTELSGQDFEGLHLYFARHTFLHATNCILDALDACIEMARGGETARGREHHVAERQDGVATAVDADVTNASVALFGGIAAAPFHCASLG